jgi:hypothetical protein
MFPKSRRQISHPGPRLASFDFASSSRRAAGLGVGHLPSGSIAEMGSFVPCRGRSAGRRSYRRKFSFWRLLSFVVVGLLPRSSGPRSIFAKFFGAGCGIGLLCDRLRGCHDSPL